MLGLDERQGFTVVGVGNAQKVQSEIATGLAPDGAPTQAPVLG